MPTAIIIDDNYDNRQIFRTILDNSDFVVTDYEDPVQGLEVLKTRTFDLLILDLQMPILSGRALLKQIRPLALHDNMKVIVVTAHPHMTSKDIDDNADFVMNKPISPPMFSLLVKRILGLKNDEPPLSSPLMPASFL